MEKEEYIKKSITITKKQNKWLSEDCISLSKFVQKQIQKKIDSKKE